MKISVCMCTYNGEKYIKEQIESLLKQTKKPDEIVIYDDCSSDNTFNIINEFKKDNIDIVWKVFRNDINKGWKVNFHMAINECTGDYIFLCDQDDIWINNKIENMINIMNKCDIEVLACNFYIKRNKNSVDNIEMKIKDKIKKVSKNSFLTYTAYPGCTYCFKKEVVPIYNQVFCDEFPHDAMIWKIGYLREKLYVTNQIGIIWRRHDECATNKTKKIFTSENVLEHYKTIYLYEKYFKSLLKIENITSKNENKIKKVLKMLELRKKLYEKKSFICFIFLLKYIMFYASVKAYIFDCLALTKLNKISNRSAKNESE